jgi:hypothetical protein
MIETSRNELNVERLAEEHYVEAPAELSGCKCSVGRRLSVALSEQRGKPELFSPDHKGISNAYCATHGRRCGR